MDARCSPTLRIVFVALALGAAAGAGSPALARMWTSVSGSSIEAEMIGREGSFVLLERPDGVKLKIDIRKLSEADRVFVQEASREPSAPGQGDGEPAGETTPPAGTAFGPVRFEPAPAVPIATLPSLNLRSPETATGYAVQYGPGANDVIVFVFDRPDPTTMHDTLYVYAAGLPAYRSPKRLEGKGTTIQDSRVNAFDEILVTTRFGSLEIEYTFEFLYGIVRPEILALRVEMELRDGRESSICMIGGFINEDVVTGADRIPVHRVLAAPELSLSVRARGARWTASATLKMGRFELAPGKNMSDSAEIMFLEDNGDEAFDLEYPFEEERLIDTGHAQRITLDDYEGGTTYEVVGTIDLGPTLGTLESRKQAQAPGGSPQ